MIGPSLASQTAIGVVSNSSDVKQIIKNYAGDGTTIIERASSTTFLNVEAPEDTTPNVNLLSVGDVDESILMYPNEVLTYPTAPNTTFYIKSAVPIAVYTIGKGNDKLLLESDESKLEYDPIYHRFNHGIVSPQQTFPHLTTKCQMATDYTGYIVLDNRYFPAYSIVEIRST